MLNATAGWASTISRMAGVPLPIVTHPLQACVTEPLKPFLDQVIVSATLHVYVNQTDKGELVIGAEIDPYQSYSMRGTLPTLEQMATYTLELFPATARCAGAAAVGRDLRHDARFRADHWRVRGGGNFYMDVGWGTYGFKAGPIAGKCVAELIATGKTPKLDRAVFAGPLPLGRLVGEKAAGGRIALMPVAGEVAMNDGMKSIIQDKGIEFFFCSFVELSGAPKAKLVPATHFEEMARDGAGFAGFACGQVGQGPHDPDLMSIPDLDALTVLPWRKRSRGCRAIFTSTANRGRIARAPSWRSSWNVRGVWVTCSTWAVEPEFMLLKKTGESGYEPWDPLDTAGKPCYDLRALYRNLDVMTTLIRYMQELGWEPYANDHEDANCQFEIN